jgi:hypothetical protein
MSVLYCIGAIQLRLNGASEPANYLFDDFIVDYDNKEGRGDGSLMSRFVLISIVIPQIFAACGIPMRFDLWKKIFTNIFLLL